MARADSMDSEENVPPARRDESFSAGDLVLRQVAVLMDACTERRSLNMTTRAAGGHSSLLGRPAGGANHLTSFFFSARISWIPHRSFGVRQASP